MEIALYALNFFYCRIGSIHLLVMCKLKAPIHISALEVAPVVPKHHTIRVRNGYDPKLKLIPQLLHTWVGREQIVY
jgi:hypothetical protein